MSLSLPNSKVYAIITAAARVSNIIGMVTLVVMMLLTVTDVVLRYFFNSPISGGTEITELMMVCLFLGVPYCTHKGQALRMELIAGKLSKKTQFFLDAMTDMIGLASMLFLTWTLVEEMRYVLDAGVGSVVLDIPTFPFFAVLAFSIGLLCLVVFRTIVENLIKGVNQ